MGGANSPGARGDKAPLLYLDALSYARRVFGSDDAHWFETPTLLVTYRQALQSLRPDWLLFPMLEWATAWWQANGLGEVPPKPLRALKARLGHEGLRAALLDALRALHSITGSATKLALQIDGPEQWLGWSGSNETEIDEGEAEDAVVYLAALLHTLAGSGVSAVLVRQHTRTRANLDDRYASLTNAANHHEWASVLCCVLGDVKPKNFGLLAARQTLPGFGAWLNDDEWANPVAPAAPFIVTQVPSNAKPDAVLTQIARWRSIN